MIQHGTSSIMRNKLLSDSKGVAAIEFAIVFPVLVLLLIASVVLVEGFRAKRLHERAAFTIVDLVTRQNMIDESSAQELYLIGKALVGPRADNSDFKIVIASAENKFDTNNDSSLSLLWSCASSPSSHFKQQHIDGLDLPEVPEGQAIVITQVSGIYEPILHLDFIGDIELVETTVRRPRFLNMIELEKEKGSCREAT